MTDKSFKPLPDKINILSAQVVDAAIEVHRALGPGLLESTYHTCLCHEFSTRKIGFQSEVDIPISYKKMRLNAGLRLDLLVENCIILELKSVEKMVPLFDAQLLTYLKLTKMRLGFLLNFNVLKMKDGIKRFIL